MTTDITLAEASIERLPPQSIEAEQAILGALLISSEAIARVVDKLEPDYFYRKAHQVIYAAVLDLYDKNEPIDVVTVSQYLKDQGKLDSVGGRQYLTDLGLSIATTANAEYYAKTVNEKALLRNLIKAGTEIVASCYEDTDADLVVDKAEHLIFNIAQRRNMGQLFHIKDVVQSSFERIEQRYENRDVLSGIPSGFYDLDELTSGFQKSDLIIIAARPSMGKCLAHDSKLVLDDGSIASIEEIYKSGMARLLTLHKDFKLGWTSPSAFVDDGIKPVFKVTTRLGRTIETTITHPFLTIDGWKKLGEIEVGTDIAVPRLLPVEGTKTIRECEIKLLAYLLGDGCVSNGKVSFTNNNQRLREDFTNAAKSFGSLSTREETRSDRATTLVVSKDALAVKAARSRFAAALSASVASSGRSKRSIAEDLNVSPASITHWTKAFTSPSKVNQVKLANMLDMKAPDDEIRMSSENGLITWLKTLGVYQTNAHTKSIPSIIFQLRRGQVALFLNRLFATDGWASVFSSGQAQIGYCSVSETLARQVQHLLLRFGVIAKLRQRKVNYKNTTRLAWQVEVTDRLSLETFINEIGIFGKEAATLKISTALIDRNHQTNCDLIPISIWDHLKAARGNESWASVGRRSGIAGTSNLHVGRRALTRGRLHKLGTALNSDNLTSLAESDVYWDRIVSITYMGEKQVYDLTIPETHNFVANDICVHNTAFALNIAQHAAVEMRRPVAIFNLEMSKEQLVQRLLCAEAKIDANKLRTGFLQNSDWASLSHAIGKLTEAPVFIDDSPVVTALDIRAKARRLKSEMKDLGLIVIDYLQLMQGRSRGGSDANRVQEVSEISRGLKTLARELDVPVIALSQLSRAVEARQNKRPMLSDLRESGSIEQDADIVMFLYRDEYYNPESEHKGEAEVIIAKQRNGPTGNIELLYQASITRFLNKMTHNTYASQG
jgi:replicative DNA helicase